MYYFKVIELNDQYFTANICIILAKNNRIL